MRFGWSSFNMRSDTFNNISKQVNIMVDACYNIVKNKNLTIRICQEMNKSVFSFSISIDVNKKRKKKSPSQKKREEKRRKDWIKQKEDAKKHLTTDDSEASDKCESPPIVPDCWTPRWLATLLQIQNGHQQLMTAKREPSNCSWKR